MRNRRRFLLLGMLLLPAIASADLPLDVTKHGVVYRHPDMARATVRKNIVVSDSPRFDLYLPPGRKGGKLPVVVFINGVGDVRGKLKEWAIYVDWARLVAARGHAAILHETDPGDAPGSIRRLFQALATSGGSLGIDPARIAVWACSANVTPTIPFLMDRDAAPPGLRAAVIYYGTGSAKTMRTDLPVFWVLAGKDDAGLIQGQRALWARAADAGAPWTMINAPGLPHAFDALDASDESRAVVAATLAFFDAHLGKLPAPPAPSAARDILALMYGREYDKAAARLEARTAENPRDADAWMTLGWARRNLDRSAEAEQAYLKALEIEPDNAFAHRAIVQTRAQAGNCDGAVQQLGKLASPDGVILSTVGGCQLKAKQWEAGASTFERAFAAGARTAEVKYNLACAYAQLGRREEALAALEAAVELGFSDGKGMAADADLAPLRKEPRFQALLAKLPRS